MRARSISIHAKNENSYKEVLYTYYLIYLGFKKLR